MEPWIRDPDLAVALETRGTLAGSSESAHMELDSVDVQPSMSGDPIA